MATLFSDAFGTGTDPDATNWQQNGGANWDLLSGVLRCATVGSPSTCLTTASAHAATADVKVSIKQISASADSDGGPCARWTAGTSGASSTGYAIDCWTDAGQGKIELFRHNGAALGTLLRTQNITRVANAVLRLEVSGGSGAILLKQFLNGVQQGFDYTDGDTSLGIAAGNRTGVYAWGGSTADTRGHYDDFLAETIGGSATLSGTLSGSSEADIVAGGKTVILTLTGDTYVPTSSPNTIQYVGGQSGSFAGKTGTTSVNFALTNGLASTPAAGDLVIITYGVGSTADRALTIQNATGTNYDLLGAELYANGTFDANQRTAFRFMPGTPETSFVLSGTGSTADAGAYTVHVYRNVDINFYILNTPTTATGTGTRLPNPASITPSYAGSLIYVAGVGAMGTGGTYTAVYLTDFRAPTSVDTNDVNVGAGHVAWTSGAYDPAAFGGGGTDNAADSWTAVTVVLIPTSTTPFANARQAIIDGLVSGQVEANGWNATVKTAIPVANVVRTSNTVVTVTLPAVATYDITAQEIITATIPASALTGATAIVAAPTATISVGAGNGTANATGVSSTASSGSVSASGSATATITGASVTASAGTVSARGDASTTTTGVQASTAIGTSVVSGHANASPSGLSAQSSVGTVDANNGAVTGNAVVTGVSASASSGVVTANGEGRAAVSGSTVSAALGTTTTSAEGRATATGAIASSATGGATGQGDSRVFPSGLSASSSLGSETARGDSNAQPSGLQLSAASGTASANGSASVSVAGQQASISVGNVDAGAGTSASAAITGLALNASAGSATASGDAFVNVSGLSLSALSGTLTASADASVTASGMFSASSVGSVTASGGISADATVTGVAAVIVIGTVQAFSGDIVTAVDIYWLDGSSRRNVLVDGSALRNALVSGSHLAHSFVNGSHRRRIELTGSLMEQ